MLHGTSLTSKAAVILSVQPVRGLCYRMTYFLQVPLSGILLGDVSGVVIKKTPTLCRVTIGFVRNFSKKKQEKAKTQIKKVKRDVVVLCLM